MRVIEEKMVAALKDKKDWNGGNTKVVRSSDYSDVWLFDKHIATLYDTGDLQINERTFIAWPTSTTASRLNGLFRGLNRNDRASIRGGYARINDTPLL